MKLRIHDVLALGAAVALGAAGCGMDGSDSGELAAPGAPVPPGSVGVSQGGAQDFGLFRQILEDGEMASWQLGCSMEA